MNTDKCYELSGRVMPHTGQTIIAVGDKSAVTYSNGSYFLWKYILPPYLGSIKWPDYMPNLFSALQTFHTIENN